MHLISDNMIKYKLLQINTVVNFGSTGRIVEEIGSLAIKKGWESHIAYGRYDRLSNSSLFKIGDIWDNYYHVLNTRLFDRHGLCSNSATYSLIDQINKIKPNIIHLHNIHGYYLNYEILFDFLNSLKIPLVWTLHDCWPMTGHCTHFDYVKCNKWQQECQKCPQIREYPKSFFFDRSKKNYLLKKKKFSTLNNLTIVSVSKWLNSVVEKSFLSKHLNQIIYNGIDVEIFSDKWENKNEQINELINNNNFIMLGVATDWTKHSKRLEDYISLSEKIDKIDKIVLVGLSKKVIKKLPSNIIGIERTENPKELAALYCIANVTLNLSVEESFGLTTVEGLSCGIPSIVYNCTASPELISQGTGVAVKEGNINEILDAINIIKVNGKTFYKSECRKRALECFDKRDRYNDYLNLYNKLLSNNKYK